MMPFEKLNMISCFFSLNVVQNSILPFVNQINQPGVKFFYCILFIKIILSVMSVFVTEYVK